MEPLSTAERLAAMVGRLVVRPCRARVDRSRPTETPGCAGSGLAPGAAKPRRGGRISARAGATARCHGRNPRSIKARSRARVGIGDAAAMGGVMHPRAAREGGVAAGGERVAAGIDGDVVMPPIHRAPTP